MATKSGESRRHRAVPTAVPCAGVAALMLGAFGVDDRAHAAEGALSHYLPGSIGDFGIALVPEPGLQVANILWWQGGSAMPIVYWPPSTGCSKV